MKAFRARIWNAHVCGEIEDAAGKISKRFLLRNHSFPDRPLSQSYNGATETVSYTTSTYSRSMRKCDQLADVLKTNPAVLSFTMLLVDDAVARDTAG